MTWETPSAALRRLNKATTGLQAPFAVIDLAAFDANRRSLARRAGGCPIRVASKSLRTRWALDEALSHSGFQGVLAFTLPEAIWLATDTDDRPGIDDVVIGYPTVDLPALRELASSPILAERITLMIDDISQVELAAGAANPDGPQIRVCIDVDASWRPSNRLGERIHVGVRRSPLHEVAEVLALVDFVVAHPAVKLVGLMFYEAQIAGLGDQPVGHKVRGRVIASMQAASAKELAKRRPEVVAAVAERLANTGCELEFVNAGGTGSLESSSADPSVTEVTAGSGFFAPTLFDTYSHFTLAPAALFALPVVRRPSPGIVTVLGGGYVASGIADQSRLPSPYLPTGLKLDSQEGAGEVQTPLRGTATDELAVGDQVWFRHAKAGELAERFAEFTLIRGTEIVDVVPTYRGEDRTFL